MLSDIKIAQQAQMKPIAEIAAALGTNRTLSRMESINASSARSCTARSRTSPTGS